MSFPGMIEKVKEHFINLSKNIAFRNVRIRTKRKHQKELKFVSIYINRGQAETGLTGADQSNADNPKAK